ncbi:hypothetical protein TWF506_000132 [Arthrobotrys conoides]|uniref:Uncharacterized protein n=1 Tax=Arthrobotrys conoides TaxID=74498 RepID=A0AAN8PQG1_9PEZI
MLPSRVKEWRGRGVVKILMSTLHNVKYYLPNETWASMSCRKVLSCITAGLCVAPTLLVSAVPDLELSVGDYSSLVNDNFGTLGTLGQHFSQFANLLMHLDNFQPEVVDPLHLTVLALSDPNENPSASQTGGYNEETGQFDLPALDIYQEIDTLIANILPRPVSLPSDIWTTHDGPMVTTTFEQALKLLGTELTYGADDPTIPENLMRWLFDAEIGMDGIILKSDRFLTLQIAIRDLDTYIGQAVEAVDQAAYLAQWNIEYPSLEGVEEDAMKKLFKKDLDRAKGFWIEIFTASGEIVRGVEEVHSIVWPDGA